MLHNHRQRESRVSYVNRLAATLLTLASFLMVHAAAHSHVDAQERGAGARSKPARPGPKYSPDVPPPTDSEVEYGDHPRQVLDFWKASSVGPTPVAFVIHGGAWRGGSKERINRFVDVKQLLDAGVSVVAINYRYVTQADPNATTPPVHAPLHDAARALQFVRSKAQEWNLDSDKFGAAGGSAGACSSLWLSFHDEMREPGSRDTISRESTRLQCAAVGNAQTTLDPKQMREWTPNSKYGGHAFGIQGKGFEGFYIARPKILSWINEYSPYALVSKDDPPVALYYTAKPELGKPQTDPTHTSNFGVKLQEHCQTIGTECHLAYPGVATPEYPTPTDFLIRKLTNKTP